MPHLTLLYARSWTVGGVLIRLGQWFGHYSHVGILTPEGTVIDARAFAGVTETPYDEWARRYSHVTPVEVECPEPGQAVLRARGFVGNGYDYRAIMNFVLRKVGQDKNRWHCVELVEYALGWGGRPRFRTPVHRITPQQSYSVI